MAAPAAPLELDEDQARRYRLLRSVGCECIAEDELRNMILKKPSFRLYDGFEPSGRMHIAQGVFKAINVNKCTQAGGTFVFWIADWFALMNNKMGGDMQKIQMVGNYFIEVFRAAGMDLDKVIFEWSSKYITERADRYWYSVLDIARQFTLKRMNKCCQIMGRQEGNLSCAQILYPLMQCADIFALEADVCQLGLDQRKVNMLAREYCDCKDAQYARRFKPIILSHHMLSGLAAGEAKMSKSNPDSAVFVEDPPEEVERKLLKATFASVLDYAQHLVFSKPGASFKVGEATYESFEALSADIEGGKIEEKAVTEALIVSVNELVEPIRKHFRENDAARDLIERVRHAQQELKENPKTTLDMIVKGSPSTNVVYVHGLSPRTTFRTLTAVRNALLKFTAEGQPAILFFPDMELFTLNSLHGKKDVIAEAINTVKNGVLALLPAEAKSLVKVVVQSDFLKEGQTASDFWTRVINVGRQIPTNVFVPNQDIGDGDEKEEKKESGDISQASHVISPCLLVSSLIELQSKHVTIVQSERTLPSTVLQAIPKALSTIFNDNQIGTIEVKVEEARENDEGLSQLTIFSSKIDINGVVKKLFCEEGNVERNPVLEIASELLLPRGPVTISKKGEGDVSFTNRTDLERAFQEKTLHPGDVKSSLSGPINEAVAALTKEVGDFKKLQQYVKNNKL